jgi:hypothetical protein
MCNRHLLGIFTQTMTWITYNSRNDTYSNADMQTV